MAILKRKRRGAIKTVDKKKTKVNSQVSRSRERPLRKTRSVLECNQPKKTFSQGKETIDLPPIAHFSKYDEWTDLYEKLLNSGWK